MIGPLGHDQPHVDPAAGRQAECPGEHLVGHEVRRDDPDPVPGRERSGPGAIRRADRRRRRVRWPRPERRSTPSRRAGPAIALARAGRVSVPVVNRQSDAKSASRSATAGPSTTIDRSCHRPVQPTAADVRPCKVHAAGQRDSAVDHDQLAMIPQVGPPAKRDVEHRHEVGNLSAGVDQRGQEPPPDPPRAEVVEQASGPPRPLAARRVRQSTRAWLPSSLPRM